MLWRINFGISLTLFLIQVAAGCFTLQVNQPQQSRGPRFSSKQGGTTGGGSLVLLTVMRIFSEATIRSTQQVKGFWDFLRERQRPTRRYISIVVWDNGTWIRSQACASGLPASRWTQAVKTAELPPLLQSRTNAAQLLPEHAGQTDHQTLQLPRRHLRGRRVSDRQQREGVRQQWLWLNVEFW